MTRFTVEWDLTLADQAVVRVTDNDDTVFYTMDEEFVRHQLLAEMLMAAGVL